MHYTVYHSEYIVLILICVHIYFRAELNSNHRTLSDIFSDSNSKSSDILSDGSAKHILRPAVCKTWKLVHPAWWKTNAYIYRLFEQGFTLVNKIDFRPWLGNAK